MALFGKVACPMLGTLTTDGWTYLSGGYSTGEGLRLSPTASITWGTPSSGVYGGKVVASNQPVLSIASGVTLTLVYLMDAVSTGPLNLAATSDLAWFLDHAGGFSALDPASTFTESGTFTVTSMSVSIDYSTAA